MTNAALHSLLSEWNAPGGHRQDVWQAIKACADRDHDEFIQVKLVIMALDLEERAVAKEAADLSHQLLKSMTVGALSKRACRAAYTKLAARWWNSFEVEKSALDLDVLCTEALNARAPIGLLEFLLNQRADNLELQLRLADELLAMGNLERVDQILREMPINSDAACLLRLKVQILIGEPWDAALLSAIKDERLRAEAIELAVCKDGAQALDCLPNVALSILQRCRIVLGDDRITPHRRVQLVKELLGGCHERDDAVCRELFELGKRCKNQHERITLLETSINMADRIDSRVIKQRLFDEFLAVGSFDQAAKLIDAGNPMWTSRHIQLLIKTSSNSSEIEKLVDAVDRSSVAAQIVQVLQDEPAHCHLLKTLIPLLEECPLALVTSLFCLLQNDHNIEASVLHRLENISWPVRDDDVAKAVWNLGLLCFNLKRYDMASMVFLVFHSYASINERERQVCQMLQVLSAAEYCKDSDAHLVTFKPTVKKGVRCRPFLRNFEDKMEELDEMLAIAKCRISMKLQGDFDRALPTHVLNGALLMSLFDLQGVDESCIQRLLDTLVEVVSNMEVGQTVRLAFEYGFIPTNIEALAKVSMPVDDLAAMTVLVYNCMLRESINQLEDVVKALLIRLPSGHYDWVREQVLAITLSHG